MSQAMFFGSALVSPNITKKVYMRTSTSSGSNRNGAKENKGEHDKKENVTDGGK